MATRPKNKPSVVGGPQKTVHICLAWTQASSADRSCRCSRARWGNFSQVYYYLFLHDGRIGELKRTPKMGIPQE